MEFLCGFVWCQSMYLVSHIEFNWQNRRHNSNGEIRHIFNSRLLSINWFVTYFWKIIFFILKGFDSVFRSFFRMNSIQNVCMKGIREIWMGIIGILPQNKNVTHNASEILNFQFHKFYKKITLKRPI